MVELVVPIDDTRRSELLALRSALEGCWSAETSFWPDEWTVARPSHGQCAMTAVIVHDRFGGEILHTTNQGEPHYWNRIDGIEVDLTRDQFDRWAPDGPATEIGRDELLHSGPTLAHRHQILVADLDHLR